MRQESPDKASPFRDDAVDGKPVGTIGSQSVDRIKDSGAAAGNEVGFFFGADKPVF